MVDLDGTLLRTNSFSRFVVWFAMRSIRRGRWRDFCRIASQVVSRKMRCQTHAETKRHIMELSSASLSEADFVAFAHTLRRWIRVKVTDLIRSHMARGGEVLMATAAPAEYAAPLAAITGIESLIASERSACGGKYRECKGEEKLRRVRGFCAARGMRIAAVVTDHYDDLPLMKCSDRVVLVSPSRKTLLRIRQENLSSAISVL